jgi:hypothetical protein
MTGTLVDSPSFTVNEVYQISANEPLQAAAVGASFNGIGVANEQAQQLANRTALLRQWLLQEPFYAVDSGTANALSITLSISNNGSFGAAPVTYSSLIGVLLLVIVHVTNTTATTIRINGQAAIPVVNPDGTALRNAELSANWPVLLSVMPGAAQVVLLAGSRNPEFNTVVAAGAITALSGNITASGGRFRSDLGSLGSNDPNSATILGDFTNTLGVPGKQQLPSGYTEIWANGTTTTGQEFITFPFGGFPTACLEVFAQEANPIGWVAGGSGQFFATTFGTMQYAPTQFALYCMRTVPNAPPILGAGVSYRYRAIGY